MSQNLLAWSGLAYDSQALNGLKRDVAAHPQENLKQVAQQLEGMFVQLMLKSMRSALPQEGILNSDQTRLYTSLYDQQLAQQMSQKGVGLAEIMLKQLSNVETNPDDTVGTVPMALDKQVLQTLVAQRWQQQLRRVSPELAPPVTATRLSNDNFVSQLSLPVRLASQQSGIPHLVIMAQAALESGWGKREILTAEGKPSHNLFGIKASGGWQGPFTEITTTEFEQGVAKKIKARFRVYGSYLEAIGDYIKLLTKNPRYANVAASSSPEQAAHALQKAGYATDPMYAKKLVTIIQQIRNTGENAVKAYRAEIAEIKPEIKPEINFDITELF